MGASFDVIVIGGGTNGLAAAAILARRGPRVLLLEQGPLLGGDAAPSEFAPGFRAPPDALDPGWVPPAVLAAAGVAAPASGAREFAGGVALGGGEFFLLPADPSLAAEAIQPRSPRDAASWASFAGRLGKLAGFLESLYLLPPPDVDVASLGELLRLAGLGRKLRALGREDMVELLRVLPMAVQELLDGALDSEPLKAILAAAAVRDIRQGPRSGGTAFVLLHHLVGARRGAPGRTAWWREGPDALVRSLEVAARGAGVTIRTDAAVQRIEIRDDAVAGVVLASGEEIPAAAVLSSLDPGRTLLGLVDPVWLDPEVLRAVRNIKFRGARTTVTFAIEGDPGLPGDGVLTLTASTTALEQAYDPAKYGAVAPRPHVTVGVPTRQWPDLAPAGHHVVVAHAQWTPHRLREPDGWTADRAEGVADAVTAALDQAVPGLAGRVRHRVTLSPAALAARYGLTEGAVSHGELTLDQILFMRPIAGFARYRMPVAGLYLGGAGAHPGPGILGAPAWLAARALVADLKDRRP